MRIFLLWSLLVGHCFDVNSRRFRSATRAWPFQRSSPLAAMSFSKRTASAMPAPSLAPVFRMALETPRRPRSSCTFGLIRPSGGWGQKWVARNSWREPRDLSSKWFQESKSYSGACRSRSMWRSLSRWSNLTLQIWGRSQGQLGAGCFVPLLWLPVAFFFGASERWEVARKAGNMDNWRAHRVSDVETRKHHQHKLD